MIRKGIVWVLLGLLLSQASVQAKEVQVREVNLTLYNKPVTGYRMVLDRNTDLIVKKIEEHLASYQVKPFRFEQTIIYENILYSPITETKEISLHYLLKNLENQLTELTVVVMYDYKRSISTREFPDLSQRLLADLSGLTRKTNGATLKFQGKIIDSPQPESGTSLTQREEEAESNRTIEHFAEEEVENNSVLLKKDPFQTAEGNNAPKGEVTKELAKQLASLQAWEEKLNKREAALNSQVENLEREQKQHEEQLDQYKVLIDSLVKLQKDKGLESQYSKYAGDPRSFSLSDYILDQEELYSKLSRDYVELNYERDSQKVKLQDLEIALAQTESRNEALLRDLEKERKAKNDIKAQWMVAMAQEGTPVEENTWELSDNLVVQDSLQAIIDHQKEEMASLEKSSDAAKLNYKREKLKNTDLQALNRELTADLKKAQADLNSSANVSVAEGVATPPAANNDSLIQVIRTQSEEIGKLESRLDKQGRELTLQKNKYQDLLDRNQEVQAELEKTKETLAMAKKSSGTREGVNQSIQLQTLRDSYEELEGLMLAEKETNKQIPILQDSIKLLKVRLNVQSTSNPEIDRLKKEKRKLNEDLKARQTQVNTLKQNNDRLTAQVKKQRESNTDLKQRLQMANQQIKASGQVNVSELQARVDKYDAEVKELRKENGNLKNQNQDYSGRVTTLENVINLKNDENATLNKKVADKNNEVQSQRLRNDSLNQALGRLKRKSGEQAIEIADQQIRMDSLIQASTQPLSVQEQFIRQQRAKLDAREQALDSREEDIARAQKRTDQREAFIKEREGELATAEKRFSGLQRKEDELNIIEQKLRQNVAAAQILDELEARRNGGKKPSTTERFDNSLQVSIKSGKVAEFGRYVPLYETQVGLGVKTVQKRVSGFMIYLGHLYDEKFPDFIYEKIEINEITPEKLNLKIRLAPSGTGTLVGVSFRLKSGQYIQPDKTPVLHEKAQQFITRMLRFNI